MGFRQELEEYTDSLIELYLKDELTFQQVFEKTQEKMKKLQKKYAIPFYMV